MIRSELEELWEKTQRPELHQRWDRRFSKITYLPRPGPAQPQRFLYATRIGFGSRIAGTGESLAQREERGGRLVSSLKFASDDPKSLIATLWLRQVTRQPSASM